MSLQYILQCMYLDLRDLLHTHANIVHRNRLTPEIKLLVSRIAEMEKKLGVSNVLSVRNIFDHYSKRFTPNEVTALRKLQDYLDLSNVGYESATDFFIRLRNQINQQSV